MSITNKLNQIKNAIYGKEVRGAIHDAIKQVYDDASVNHDNANMEVKLARGTHNTLNDRLDNVDEIQAQTNAQLSTVKLQCINVFDYKNMVKSNDWTDAIQTAINKSIETGIPLYLPPNQYHVSRTLVINNAGFTMYGANCRDTVIMPSSDFNGVSNSPILFINIEGSSNATDKTNIHDIGFDARNNNNNCRGIQFEFLIYSSSFRNLDFNYFTGSSLYSLGNKIDVSEMITFEQIRINPLTKTPVEPLVNFKKVNESLFINCRFFAKQANSDVVNNYPLVRLEQCQGISFTSNSFFYADNAPILKVESKLNAGVTQGIFMRDNTIERCKHNVTLEFDSEGTSVGQITENVVIDYNRINVSTYKLKANNISKFIVKDIYLTTELNGLCDSCYIEYNSSYGVKCIDNSNDSSRVTVVDVSCEHNTSSCSIVNAKKRTYAKAFAKDTTAGVEFQPNNSANKKVRVETFCDYSDFANAKLNFVFDGITACSINPRGFKLKVVSELPLASGLYEGMIYFLNVDSNNQTPYLCIKQSGSYVWRKLQWTV